MEEKFRYKYGFLLGKFMPPHEGHLYLVREAKKQVEHLTVLVCTLSREPIPGELRYEWMKMLAPYANVIHVTEDVPSYPHEHPDFDAIWTDLLRRYIHPETEVVFSAEPYGNDIATWLSIDHIRLDRVYGTSGTNIRTAPFANWKYIPAPVRPYYARRIVLTGPESTGKTWMARKLAEHFNTAWVAEYGREHFELKNGRLTIDDISQIAEIQLKREDEAARQANRILFCDTDLIVTQVWSEIYFGRCPQWIVDVNHERKYDLFLLMDIDIPWEDDGTREFPHLRELHFQRLKDELAVRRLNYVIISGQGEHRLRNAIEAVEGRFGTDLQ
jgi:HTH-type transcriptional regulator, transcriptional repressor of NAD biosynthesis genes